MTVHDLVISHLQKYTGPIVGFKVIIPTTTYVERLLENSKPLSDRHRLLGWVSETQQLQYNFTQSVIFMLHVIIGYYTVSCHYVVAILMV